jgi:hypothetical protein
LGLKPKSNDAAPPEDGNNSLNSFGILCAKTNNASIITILIKAISTFETSPKDSTKIL